MEPNQYTWYNVKPKQIVKKDGSIGYLAKNHLTDFNDIYVGKDIKVGNEVITEGSSINEVIQNIASGSCECDIKNITVNGEAVEIDDSKVAHITVPTKTSDLDNDAGFLTEHQDISSKVDKDELFNYSDSAPVIKASLLPSYVDDVVECENYGSLPKIGETSKIYVTIDDGKCYRWGGSVYVEICEAPDLSGYLLKSEAASTYQPKGDYLTEETDPTVPRWAKAESKPSYGSNEITHGNGFVDSALDELSTNKADKNEIPTKVSELENDSGFLTEHQDISNKLDVNTAAELYQPKGNYLTHHQDISGKLDKTEAAETYQPKGNYLTEETDPTVPEWAKTESKPTYNANEIKFGNGFVDSALDDLYNNKADVSEIPTKVSQLENDSGFLTEHQDISGKIDRSELFTNGVFETVNIKNNGTKARLWNESDGGGAMIEDGSSNVKAFVGVNEGSNDNGIYAQIYAKDKSSNIGTRINVHTDKIYYTKNKSNSNVVADDEIVVKGDIKNFLTEHQDISGKLDKTEAAETYQVKGDYVLAERVNALSVSLNKALSEITVLKKVTEAKSGTTGVVSEPGQAISIDDSTTDAVISGVVDTVSTIKANSVDISGLTANMPTGTGNSILINSNDVSITDSNLNGSSQSNSNLVTSINTESLVIKDTVFGGNTYNTIMTGQQTTSYLKDMLIENCTFDENCKHINIWFAGFQDNATLTIKNCHFKTCEQFLCVSDFSGTNNTLTINIQNCTIDNYETGTIESPDQYEGIILMDDRTCTSRNDFIDKNPFGAGKITINISNLTVKGTKITSSNFIMGSGQPGQMLYVYSVKGGGCFSYSGNETLFPTINVVD